MNDTSDMMNDNRTDICTSELADPDGHLYGRMLKMDISTTCKCCGQGLPEDQRPKIPEYVTLRFDIDYLRRCEGLRERRRKFCIE